MYSTTLKNHSTYCFWSNAKLQLLELFLFLTTNPKAQNQYLLRCFSFFLFNNHIIYSWSCPTVCANQWIILQYVNTGKYCFILKILILGLFTEALLIWILMLSIQNLILMYVLVFPVFYSISILCFKPLIYSCYLRLLAF